MNILYIKRAYNSRLHAQINALHERSHSIVLLLEAWIGNGYNGPRQWDPAKILSRFPVYYSKSAESQTSLPISKGSNRFRLLKDIEAGCDPDPGECRPDRWSSKQYPFLHALEDVLSIHDVDVIISGNDAVETEDYRTKLVISALKGKIPIVYDCQDILSDCFFGNRMVSEIECFVNEESDGVVHTNPIGLEWVRSKYRIGKALAFPNYASEKCFSRKRTKLSGKAGGVHVVYCGSVQKTPKGFGFPFARDMRNMFEEIAALGVSLHLHLGLYPGTDLYQHYAKLERYNNVILHPYVPFDEMMSTLTQYDIGILPFDIGSLRHQVEREGPHVLNDFFLSRADTLKQYEYILAGLPVLTVPVKWISAWLEENNFGASFNSIGHLRKILRSSKIQEYAESVNRDASSFSIENRIGILERFLQDILKKHG